jgi:TonB family protein
MWPHSLLFSSDEEASRSLACAFRDLEFEVETCPEIFGAVEKITRRSFDVVVSDWNEGLEAVFLLKTVRELKANQSAFTIAIAGTEAAAAAREAGADLVLSRPLLPNQIKYALLNCDPFLVQMKSWLPRAAQVPAANTSPNSKPYPEEATPVVSPRNKVQASNLLPVPVTDSRLPAWPSPPPVRRAEPVAVPLVAAESILEDDLLYRSRVQTLFRTPEPSFSSSTTLPKKKSRNRVLPGMAIAVAFLSVGYVFSEPLRGQGTTTAVAKMCRRMLERTEAWLRPDETARPAPGVLLASNQGMQFARSSQAVTRIHVGSAGGSVQPQPAATADELPQTVPVEPESPIQQSSASTNAVRIPESLKTATVQTASLRTVAARIAPSILAALEPVSLSEDLSRRLLLQKVLPSYPEQAVKARLQGPVVLQAWIARDGTIQDLKLVRGSFLLGEAAYRAVKQWRYQPYLVNGRAVEAETFVTVDFRLP